MALPSRTGGRYLRFNSSEPNSEIEPVPSPCMAKAKSASPSRNAENFAGEAKRAHIERRMQPAMRLRHHRLEEARLAQRLHARATGGVHVIVRQRMQRGVGPARQFVGETAMAVVEKGQREGVVEAHGRPIVSLSPLGERVGSEGRPELQR